MATPKLSRVMDAFLHGSAKDQLIASDIDGLDYEASMLESDIQSVEERDPAYAESLRDELAANRARARTLRRKLS